MILLFASLFMLIDHIGFMFFPQYPFLRMLGRVSFPLFAYQCAISMSMTHSLDKFFTRLFVCALLFDLPFWLVFGFTDRNIFYIFAFSVLVLLLWQHNRVLGLLCYLFVVAVSEILGMSYGFYGISLVLIFYITKDFFILSVLSFLALIIFCRLIGFTPTYVYGFASVLILYLVDRMKRINLGRYFYYIFYPSHLLVLRVIKEII